MSSTSFIDRFVATVAHKLMNSSTGDDVRPRQTKDWINKINNYVGDIDIGKGGERRTFHVDRLLDTIEDRSQVLRSKIERDWALMPDESKESMLSAIKTVQSRNKPVLRPAGAISGDLESAQGSRVSSKLLERVFVGLVLYAFVGQQMEAAFRGHDAFYRMITFAQALKTTSQYFGHLISEAYNFRQILILAFQRNLVPGAVSFGVESTVRLSPDETPPGYEAGVISANLISILGYIAYHEWVGTENVRFILRTAGFFVSPGNVSKEHADDIRAELKLEQAEWQDLLDAFKAMRPVSDPNDFAKGLDKAASLQAGDIQQGLGNIVDMLGLTLKKLERTTEKSFLTWFAVGTAALVLVSVAPLPASFALFLGWALFTIWRQDQQAKEDARDLGDSVTMFAQAATLVLFALPFMLAFFGYRLKTGRNIFEDHPWVGKVGLAYLAFLNTAVADKPAKMASKAWKKRVEKRQQMEEEMQPTSAVLKCCLWPLVKLIKLVACLGGGLWRVVAGAMNRVLRFAGFNWTERAEELLRQLEASDAASAAAALENVDGTEMFDVLVVSLNEAAEVDDDVETLVGELDDEERAKEIDGYFTDFELAFKSKPQREEERTALGDTLEEKIRAAMADEDEDKDEELREADLRSIEELVADVGKLGFWSGRTEEFHQLMFGGHQKVD